MTVTEEEAKKYPWLVPTEGWYGPEEIPDMWKPVVLQLCEALSKYFDEHPKVDRMKYHLDQGKEKFGTARWYDRYDDEWPDNSYQEIHKIVTEYTNIMDHTCTYCGAPNAKIRGINYWMYLLCDKCYDERSKKNISTQTS